MKKNTYIEGKGYFIGYKCKNCGRSETNHMKGKCLDDLRKSFPNALTSSFEEDTQKPIFTTFIL